MSSVCKACNGINFGMVKIYSHPNKIDDMFTLLSQIEVKENDNLCIPCYDEMKIAFNFRQKCIQSELFRCNSEKKSKVKVLLTTLCDEDVKNVQNLEIDLIENNQDKCTSSKNFPCNVIVKVEKNKETKIESNKQLKDQTSERYYCKNCDMSFTREQTLKKHIETHKSDMKHKIKTKRIAGSTLKFPEEDIFQGLSELQCEYCFSEFCNIEEKKLHCVQHQTEKKPYKCTFVDCTSQFKEKYGLKNHVRIHSDVKRYKCKYCEHRFHQRGNIISHERLHTGEKPFLCPHCGKSFAESGNLKAHIRFHTGERPYTCSECPKKFKTHYSHKIHVRSHTQERPYLCSECGKSFFSSGKLLVHKRTHNGDRPYKCDNCPAAFMDSSGLKRHSKIHI